MQHTKIIPIILLLLSQTGNFLPCDGNIHNVMQTAAFVDIYGGTSVGNTDTLPSILATSDGGAIMANAISAGNLRILKVNENGGLEWVYSQSADPTIDLRETSSVEDVDNKVYYLCAVNAVNGKTFFLKLSMKTGANQASLNQGPGGYTAALSSCFISTSTYNLHYAGYLESAGPTITPDFGTIDKTTLSYNAIAVSGSTCGPNYKFSAITETKTLELMLTAYSVVTLCAVTYNPSTYVATRMSISAISAGGKVKKLFYLSSGKAYGYGNTCLYSFDSSLYISKPYIVIYLKVILILSLIANSVCVGSINSATTSYDEKRFLVLGFQSTISYARLYDLADFSTCSMNNVADRQHVIYVNSDRYKTKQHYWIAAIGSQGIYRRMMVKIEEVAPITCTGANINYFNKQCLPLITPGSNCNPLCNGNCVIANSEDGCTDFSPESDGLVYFFSARCPIMGNDFRSTVCQPTYNNICHSLCGPECFGFTNNECTRFCNPMDPNIDTSLLLSGHTCKCKAGTALISGSGKCLSSSNCSPLCATSYCGLNSGECESCKISTNVISTPGQYFTYCSCAAGTTLDSGFCVYTSGCGALCNDKCFIVSDNSKCLGCRTGANIQTSSGVGDAKICSCTGGTVPLGNQCVFNSGCDNMCDTYCGVKASSADCVSCLAVAHMKTTVIGDYSSCSCGDGSTFSNTAKKCIYTTGCYPLCSNGCTELNSNINCLACVSGSSILATALTAGLFKCECNSPASYENGYCVYNSGCSPKCGQKCTALSDNTACLSCNSDINLVASGPGIIKTCDCKVGTVYYNNLCLYSSGCDKRCDTYCATTTDNLQCLTCSAIAHIYSTNNSPYMTCSCGDNTIFSSSDQSCIYTSNCHPLCDSKCSQMGSNVHCLACVNWPTVTTTSLGEGIYKCDCNAGATYENNICVYSSGCHTLCNGKCTKQGDSDFCVDCSGGTNVVKTVSGAIYKCSCQAGTTQAGKNCLWSTDCSQLCKSGCGVKLNSLYCDDCISEANVIKSSNGDFYSCGCAPSTILVVNHCVFSSSCDNFCNSYCFVQNNPSQCLDCNSAMSNILKSATSAYSYSCGCVGGTTLYNSNCIFTTSCDPLCAVGCSIQGTSASCADCVSQTNLIKTLQSGTTNVYSCSCGGGSSLIGGVCLFSSGCHSLCNGQCLNKNDQTTCVNCGTGTNIVKTANNAYFSCTCPILASAYSGNCVFSTGCDSLCQNGCFVKNDASQCVDCIPGANVNKVASGPLAFSCSCVPGTSFSSQNCIYYNSCNQFCKSGCIVQGSSTSCIDCISGDNIFKTSQGNSIYSCGCLPGTSFDGSRCLYSSGCYGLCNGKCGAQGDSSKCESCINNPLVVSKANGAYYSCNCQDGYSLYLNSCVYISPSCSPLCNGVCGKLNDPTLCLDCAAMPNIFKQPSTGIFSSCSCSTGSKLSEKNQCILTSNCDPRCKNGCLNPMDNLNCVDCISNGNNILKTANGNNMFKCDCAIGFTYAYNSCVIQSNLCGSLCNGYCFELNNNKACLACALVGSNGNPIFSYINEVNAATCYQCQNSEFAYKGNCYTKQTNNCHPLCGSSSSCLKTQDPSVCLNGCSSVLNYVESQFVATLNANNDVNLLYNCSCKQGMQYDDRVKSCIFVSATECHALCGGKCIEKFDNTKCVTCLELPNINKTQNGAFGGFSCSCIEGAPIENSLCVFTDGCHPLCGSKCIAKNDNTKCTSCQNSQSIISTFGSLFGVMNCYCAPNYVFDGTTCKPIILSRCHTLCKSGCTEENNPLKCIDCVSEKGVKIISPFSSTSTASVVECACNDSSTMIAENGKCIYTKNCLPTCSKCFSPNDPYSCISCAPNVNLSYPLNQKNNTVICSCPVNTTYFNSSCQPIISNNCHKFCSKSQCIIPKNASFCISCKETIPHLIRTTNSPNFASCQCEANYTDDNNGNCIEIKQNCAQKYCRKCSKNNPSKCFECESIEGLILENNKCQCNTLSGFKEAADFSCFQSETKAKQAVVIGGGAAAGGVLATSLLITQSGSILWQLISAEQELALFALVSITNIPSSLASFYQGLGVFSLSIFPDIISMLFTEDNTGVSQSDNELTDNSKLHPNIFNFSFIFMQICFIDFMNFDSTVILSLYLILRLSGKLFLYNISSILTSIIITFCGVVLIKVLALKFQYFYRLSDGLVTQTILRVVSTNFVPVILCACIQMKYLLVKNAIFCIASSICAGIAIGANIIYLIIAYKTLSKPPSVLESESMMKYYIIFYEDTLIKSPQIYAYLINQFKLACEIAILVFASDYPLVQSISVLVITISSLGYTYATKPITNNWKKVGMYCTSISFFLISSIIVYASISEQVGASIETTLISMGVVLYTMVAITCISIILPLFEQVYQIYMKCKNSISSKYSGKVGVSCNAASNINRIYSIGTNSQIIESNLVIEANNNITNLSKDGMSIDKNDTPQIDSQRNLYRRKRKNHNCQYQNKQQRLKQYLNSDNAERHCQR